MTGRARTAERPRRRGPSIRPGDRRGSYPRTFAAVIPLPLALVTGELVVQSATQTPPPPQPVQPLAVMHVYPVGHCDDDEQPVRPSQKAF